MDTTWALEQLRIFERATVLTNASSGGYITTRSRTAATDSDVVAMAPVIEQILSRVIPDWRTSVQLRSSNRWTQHREACQRAIALLERETELRDKLGDDAPTLSAGGLHPWVWGGAQSMWAMAAYDRAVEDALARINYETQRKSGVSRLGETKLFQLLFSGEDPKSDAPRLRLQPADGASETPETFRNRHLAVHALAQALFAGLRNPAAHGVRTHEGDEQVALERLAAASVLARWVDDATLVRAP